MKDHSHLERWKKEMVWVWAILIALTVIGPMVGKITVAGAVLTLGVMKFFGILFSFMEAKGAHRFWLFAPMTIAMICFTFITWVLGV